jgi:hypothetical protein
MLAAASFKPQCALDTHVANRFVLEHVLAIDADWLAA